MGRAAPSSTGTRAGQADAHAVAHETQLTLKELLQVRGMLFEPACHLANSLTGICFLQSRKNTYWRTTQLTLSRDLPGRTWKHNDYTSPAASM